jgi:cholesterol transport system auxiliary component
VQHDNSSVTYVKDAQWVEAPQRLFQRLVSETVAARSNRVVLDEGQYLTAPGEQLAGQLMEFGVDARTGEAVVVYQAMLVAAGGKTVSQRRFEAREAIGGEIEAKPVGEALTRAANKVAGEVTGWLGG